MSADRQRPRTNGPQEKRQENGADSSSPAPDESAGQPGPVRQYPGERGGPKGPEPTRYGDWEKGGRCSDF